MNGGANLVERFVRVGDVLDRQFDDELIVLDLKQGQYFSLNAVGARMWRALVEGKNAVEIAEELVGEYDIDADVLARDCADLAGELLLRGLLRRSVL